MWQRSTHPLRIDGKIINDKKGLLKAWANHFEKLGTQKHNPDFDSDHKERITQTRNTIDTLVAVTKPFQAAPPVTEAEVEKAIKNLHNNKSQDTKGLTAEHLKHSIPHILHPLARLFTSCIHRGIQPVDFSTGSLTPVEKKDKDNLDPNNSRGIVISPIICKTYEHLIDGREAVTDETDPLQFGFTKKKSPTMASFIATEAHAENQDMGLPTFIASLDTQKAFDVVWQDSLAVRLFLTKPQSMWRSHTLLLEECSLQVKLQGSLSKKITTNQGVGQGKILSTKNYKDFIDPCLKIYRTSRAGCFIGLTYVGAPTCADDVLLITSSPEDLQLLLCIADKFSRQERFTIHPQKTKVIVLNGGDTTPNHQQWSLGDKLIEASPFLTHLGINRYATPTASMNTIKDRICTARRTAYALLGAGFHGAGGVNNPTMKKLLECYILPRLLYGLEALIVSSKQVQELEAFTRDLLKRLQALPSRTANEAAYILMNVLPIEAQLDIRTLNFFGKMLAEKDSILYQIAIRQLATKSLNSHSWFMNIFHLTEKYSLPTPHYLVTNFPGELRWKRIVKQTVQEYWEDALTTAVTSKGSMKLLEDPRAPPTWDHVELNTHAVARARLQARLLTNTYTLQAHRGKYYGEDPTCQLCGMEPETTVHLLASCTRLQDIRSNNLGAIYERLWSRGHPIPSSPAEVARLMLGLVPIDNKSANMAAKCCFRLVHRRQTLYTQSPPTP